jgi:hypothetical protein
MGEVFVDFIAKGGAFVLIALAVAIGLVVW